MTTPINRSTTLPDYSDYPDNSQDGIAQAPEGEEPTINDAEYIRLKEELSKLLVKNEHGGADRVYRAIVALENITISPQVHYNGAICASGMGDVLQSYQRLLLAQEQSASLSPEETTTITDWIKVIETTFGGVIITIPTDVDYQIFVPEFPFDPVHRLAIEHANNELKETGTFTGLLPLDLVYTLKPSSAEITTEQNSYYIDPLPLSSTGLDFAVNLNIPKMEREKLREQRRNLPFDYYVGVGGGWGMANINSTAQTNLFGINLKLAGGIFHDVDDVINSLDLRLETQLGTTFQNRTHPAGNGDLREADLSMYLAFSGYAQVNPAIVGEAGAFKLGIGPVAGISMYAPIAPISHILVGSEKVQMNSPVISNPAYFGGRIFMERDGMIMGLSMTYAPFGYMTGNLEDYNVEGITDQRDASATLEFLKSF